MSFINIKPDYNNKQRKRFLIEIPLSGWELKRSTNKHQLQNLRDKINELLGYQEISETFNITIPQAEEINKFHERKRECNNCDFKMKECDNCVLICESPLERKLYLALKNHNIDVKLQKRVNKDGSTYNHDKPIDKNNILTIPDFYVDRDDKKICIYADGHTYHERSEDQALRDRNIDRELQNLGFMVLRFTGKEIRREIDNVVTTIKKNLNIN